MTKKVLMGLFLTLGCLVSFQGSASAAYNPKDLGTMPADWVYPLTGAPLRDLCPYKSVLIPNGALVNGNYISQGESYINISDTLNLDFYSAIYVCDSFRSTTVQSAQTTNVHIWIQHESGAVYYDNNIGTTGEVSYDARGGDGGNWTHMAWTGTGLWEGNNRVCYRVSGGVSSTPGWYGDLGYCFNVNYQPMIAVRGRVFSLPSGQPHGGVTVDSCLHGSTATDGAGFFQFNIRKGDMYCIGVGGFKPANTKGPFVRPYTTGYWDCARRSSDSGYGSPGSTGSNPDYCSRPRYDCQIAGRSTAEECGWPGIDRTTDHDNDIMFEEVPPPKLSCTSFAPGEVSEGETFDATASIKNDPGIQDLIGATLTLTIPAGLSPSGARTFTPFNVTSGSTVTSTVPGITAASYNEYTIQWSVTGGNAPPGLSGDCLNKLVVGRRPYFKAYGGDIFAGGAFRREGVCDVTGVGTSKGRLLGNYKPGAGGAGSQLATIAMVNVDGVASASLRTSSPIQPQGLTFANTTPVTGTAFGGYSNFSTSGTAGYCAPDYFTEMQYDAANSSKTTTNSSGFVNINSDIPNGTQLVKNPSVRVKVKPGGPINKRATLFVDGDVIITENIKYSTLWNTINSIPYLAVIVRGNIYIDKDVTQMDGLYIAQPRYDVTGSIISDSGRIYTCREGSNGGPISAANAPTDCDAKLNIRGALIAQRIVLQRTPGTLKNAILNEGKTSGNIAEVINYTPEFFLGKPVFKTKANKPDSIKSLPPTL